MPTTTNVDVLEQKPKERKHGLTRNAEGLAKKEHNK